MLAADFLLTFGEHDDIYGKAAVGGEMRLQGLHVEIQLSLVVHGSARVDAPVANGGLEGLRVP
jgi:hypothetical protein